MRLVRWNNSGLEEPQVADGRINLQGRDMAWGEHDPLNLRATSAKLDSLRFHGIVWINFSPKAKGKNVSLFVPYFLVG